MQVAEVEAHRVVADFLHRVALDQFVDLDGGVELHALVIEGQLERRLEIVPLELVAPGLDFLVIGKLHAAEDVGQVAHRSRIGLGGQVTGLGLHVVQRKSARVTGHGGGEHQHGNTGLGPQMGADGRKVHGNSRWFDRGLR